MEKNPILTDRLHGATAFLAYFYSAIYSSNKPILGLEVQFDSYTGNFLVEPKLGHKYGGQYPVHLGYCYIEDDGLPNTLTNHHFVDLSMAMQVEKNIEILKKDVVSLIEIPFKKITKMAFYQGDHLSKTLEALNEVFEKTEVRITPLDFGKDALVEFVTSLEVDKWLDYSGLKYFVLEHIDGLDTRQHRYQDNYRFGRNFELDIIQKMAEKGDSNKSET